MNQHMSTLHNCIQTSIAAAEQRAKHDPARPMYHFRPPAQWMNDPNGTIYHNGYYHLFYQFNPYSEKWDSIHWGHARSRDLVYWENLPVALFPNGTEEAHCASGCAAINDHGVPMLFYTNFTERLEDGPYDQRIATSDADLLHWEKHPANPFLGEKDRDAPGVERSWRDPFIFREAGRTFLILGAETEESWTIPLYEAEDDRLLSWMYRGNLYESPKNRPSPFLFECPNFVKIANKWVLLYSAIGSGVEYIPGSFELESLRFIPERVEILDRGYSWLSGLYATNTLFDPQGRCVLVAWIQDMKHGRGWNGCLTLPRLLSFDRSGHLCQTPAPELQQLRGIHRNFSQSEIHDSSQTLQNIQGKQLEILAQFKAQDAQQFGLKVRCAADGSAGFPIAYDGLDLEIGGVKCRFTPDDNDGLLTFHIFLDGSIMEVFVNGGRVCATRLIYPPDEDLGIEVFSLGGKTTVKQIDVWEMNSIWEA